MKVKSKQQPKPDGAEASNSKSDENEQNKNLSNSKGSIASLGSKNKTPTQDEIPAAK